VNAWSLAEPNYFTVIGYNKKWLSVFVRNMTEIEICVGKHENISLMFIEGFILLFILLSKKKDI
jgi:hypothetical protein